MSFNQINTSTPPDHYTAIVPTFETWEEDHTEEMAVSISPLLLPLCETEELDDGFVLSIPVEKK